LKSLPEVAKSKVPAVWVIELVESTVIVSVNCKLLPIFIVDPVTVTGAASCVATELANVEPAVRDNFPLNVTPPTLETVKVLPDN